MSRGLAAFKVNEDKLKVHVDIVVHSSEHTVNVLLEAELDDVILKASLSWARAFCD